MQQILIIEDDRALNQGLCKALKTDNNSMQVCSGLYASATDRQIVSCENLKDAKEQLLCGMPALILLDINLPDVNGFAVCSKLRENADTPILIVSARTDKADKLNGFDLGADDYIEKPYDIDILLAKIKGIFKRRYQRSILSVNGVTLNLADRTAEIDGKPVELPAKEFDLLHL